MFCYGFGLKDYFFKSIKLILQDKRLEFKNNFHGSVHEFFEKIEKEPPSIILTSIFTEEFEVQAKELLLFLRSCKESISKSPFVVFSFTPEERVDSLFKSAGCYLQQVPCEISAISLLFQKRPISEKERKDILNQFGRQFLLEKVERKIANAKHRIRGQICLSTGAVKEFCREPNRAKFQQVYNLVIKTGAFNELREIWLELNKYQRCFGQENKEIKKIGDSLDQLESLLKDGYERAKPKAKQLNKIIVYLSNLE